MSTLSLVTCSSQLPCRSVESQIGTSTCLAMRVGLRDRGEYVFDGNRVTARRAHRNKHHIIWWLDTVDSKVSLFVRPDLRIGLLRRVNDRDQFALLQEFETVFDALKPLEEALRICVDHGHVWVADEATSNLRQAQSEWCLICGAEQVIKETGEVLEWPRNAAEILSRTPPNAFTTLHGSLARRAL